MKQRQRLIDSMAMGMAAAAAAAAAASPSCSSPPWPASSSPTRTRSPSSSSFLLYTSTATRPARRLPHPRALPETALVAAGVAAAGLAAAAVLLRGDRKTDQPAPGEQGEKQAAAATEECSACGGSGLCPRCKGEGFVFKEVGEEAAGRARRAAKNMATRYTAGLPTKWTYCNRCSSTRSCTACDGAGAVPVRAKTTTTTN